MMAGSEHDWQAFGPPYLLVAWYTRLAKLGSTATAGSQSLPVPHSRSESKPLAVGAAGACTTCTDFGEASIRLPATSRSGSPLPSCSDSPALRPTARATVAAISTAAPSRYIHHRAR